MTNHPASKLIRESSILNPYQDLHDSLQNFDLQLQFYNQTLYLDQIISWLAIFALGWIAWFMAKLLVKNFKGGEI